MKSEEQIRTLMKYYDDISDKEYRMYQKQDPTRILMRQIFGAIAQYDKATIVARMRAARERKRKRLGKCEGRKAYGTREGELEIIKRMKALRASRMSFDRIADDLNKNGVQTRTPGTKWYGSAVNQILKREDIRNGTANTFVVLSRSAGSTTTYNR